MTKYCVLVRYHGREEEFVTKQFDSMMLRALFIIGLSLGADVVREWEEV